MAADGLRRPRVWTGSVRMRTAAAAVVVLGAAVVLGALVLVAGLQRALTNEVGAAATLRASEIARALDAGAAPSTVVTDRSDEQIVQIIGPAGTVIAASTNVAGRAPLARPAPGRSAVADVSFDDDAFLTVAKRAGPRTVLVARSLGRVTDATRALAGLLAVGLPVLLIVVGVTIWRVVGRALAPVEAIRAEVDAITVTQLHRRVPQPPGGDEIGRLATTMNATLDRLERAQSRERRFAADASHELRSPIAAIREHAEVARASPGRTTVAELAGTVHAEILRMQALVEDLLLLARADEHSIALRRRPTDLDDLVFDVARRLRTTTALRISTTAVSAARVDGDPAALRRALGNLADNAARHARAQVAFGLSVEDGRAMLQVDDDGPGIDVNNRDRVFERFVRLDDARSRSHGGAGLGLAIVAEIVAAHAGTVVFCDSPLGGARCTVALPLPDGRP